MMRALVLSDIHGEESRLRWMLEETWKMTGKIDGYFFLGDGVDDFAQAENFIRRRDPAGAFRAFRLNHWLGFTLFAGLVLQRAFR